MAAFRVLPVRLGATVTAFAGVPFLTHKVYAAEENFESKKVKIAELPAYGNPEDANKYDYIEEEINSIRKGVSQVREVIWDYMDSVQDTTDKIRNQYNVAKAHTSDLITYIQDDPGVLPRVGVITVAGLGGIVAGYKGGIFRKFFFSSTAMVGAAALCYPNQAVSITTNAYDTAWDYVKELWDDPSKKKEESSIKEKVTQNSTPSETPSKPVTKTDPALLDHGQSKAEDKDMYTTRGT